MNIEKELMEKIKRFEDVKNQINDLQKKIGGLQEQQRAIYNKGLELKGQIDLLVELQEKEKADSPLSKLTLPDKSLVGSDGKTPLAAAPVAQETASEAGVPGLPVEAPKAAVPEEVAVEATKSPLEVI